MKSETIKTYTEVTVEQAGEMLRDNGWSKPVEGLKFKYFDEDKWRPAREQLTGLDLLNDGQPFLTHAEAYGNCAKVTELDPCQTPDGCPEFLAYIGIGPFDLEDSVDSALRFYRNDYMHLAWSLSAGAADGNPCFIDVRTAFAQEHFPHHCRIRNYQEPNPLQEAWDKYIPSLSSHEGSFKAGWEAAIAHNKNPQPTK